MNTNLDVVIAELERNLAVLEANYQRAVSNLNTLRQCVDTDDLTKLLRRGAFMKKLSNLLDTSRKEGREVHVMMIDVDHFKKVNDTYGHQTGDVVLESVSELIRRYLRPGDLAGRYGGEEIIVALEAGRVQAMQIAENIRAALEHHTMVSVSAAEQKFNVTLSVGVASSHEFGFEADVLIGHADEALYRAKHNGRNQVVAATAAQTILLSLESAAIAA